MPHRPLGSPVGLSVCPSVRTSSGAGGERGGAAAGHLCGPGLPVSQRRPVLLLASGERLKFLDCKLSVHRSGLLQVSEQGEPHSWCCMLKGHDLAESRKSSMMLAFPLKC